MRILVVGQSSYDINAKLDNEIIQNTKYRIESTFECCGGPAFNAACLLGKWGMEVYLISRIGKDMYGEKLKEFAKENNVRLDYLIDDKNFSTPYSNIFTYKDTRTIFNFIDQFSNVDFDIDLDDVDYILTDGHEYDISLQLFNKYPNAIKVMDLGSFKEKRVEIAKHIDYLITSEQFAKSYTNLDLIEENYAKVIKMIKNINFRAVTVTLSERGLIYNKNENVAYMPSFKTNSIDSTGAGDIFHGAFVYFMANGFDYENSLKLSSLTASISTETFGSSLSIPTLKQVKERLLKK